MPISTGQHIKRRTEKLKQTAEEQTPKFARRQLACLIKSFVLFSISSESEKPHDRVYMS